MPAPGPGSQEGGGKGRVVRRHGRCGREILETPGGFRRKEFEEGSFVDERGLDIRWGADARGEGKVGREGGFEGIDEYLDIKYIALTK